MKILRCDPEEIENPNPSRWSPTWKADPDTEYTIKFAHDKWNEGKQAERKAWQAQVVDVDLDEMVGEWRWRVKRDFPLKSFTQYLKEQLEAK